MMCFRFHTTGLIKVFKYAKIRVLLILICSVSNVYVNAQTTTNIKIEGTVYDIKGNPISSVSVTLKNSKAVETTTNSNGIFKLTCKQGEHILTFSHIGYQQLDRSILVKANKKDREFYEIILKENVTSLDEVVVLGTSLSASPSLKTIKKQHKLIAGSTSVAIMTPEAQRLETIKDALKYEPGVVVQELFGANDQPRLSIRGSGIQSNPQRRGVYLLQDGIPVNFADGSFIIGVMDPSVSESIEVLKGANALRYGAATLGGAINFNSRTGRHTHKTQVKVEGGSFEYSSINVLTGDSWGDKDAFLSVSGSRQDGFREHNQNKKLSVAGNFGYRFSKNIDNRTYINYSYINFDIPGPLTLSMLKDDPTQINQGINLPFYMGPNIARDKPSREANVVRISNRTAFRLSSTTNLTVSAYYQYVKDRFVFPIVLSTQRLTGNDGGISIQAVHRMEKGTLTSGFLGSYGNIDRRGHININGLDSFIFSKDNLNAVNLNFYTEYQHRFSDRFNVIANIQAVYNERNSEDVFPYPELRPWYSHTSHKYRYFYSHNQSLDQQFSAVNPRIGVIYDAGIQKDFQFFGNLSASYEPPTFDELVGTKVTYNINTSPKELFAIELEKQSAITAEVGSRYEGSRFSWNVSLYRSWIKNELLEVKDFVLGVKQTQNYPQTIHQGIELGFTATPLKGIFSIIDKDKLAIRGMYTYSDFYFNSGVYKNNKLAGMPPHYLTGSVEYKYPGKFLLSLNAESQPKKSPIDHTNTVFQPPFTIFGFRLGFEGWKNISFYVEGKNILNKHYASSYIISDQILLPPIPFPDFTVDNLAFFMPGQTRAFYTGITYKF